MRTVVIVVTMAFLAPAAADAMTSRVIGTVVDNTGAATPGATAMLTSESTGVDDRSISE